MYVKNLSAKKAKTINNNIKIKAATNVIKILLRLAIVFLFKILELIIPNPIKTGEQTIEIKTYAEGGSINAYEFGSGYTDADTK